MSSTWRAGAVALVAGFVVPWTAAGPAAAEGDRSSLADRAEQVTGADEATGTERATGTDRAERKRDRKREGRRADRAERGPEPGQMRGASVVKAGWWWVANEPPPDTGLVAAPQPPAPNVPAGTVAVGALLGGEEKIAALELALDAEPGATVERLTLVLRESEQPGSNLQSDSARVLACPITELFWAHGDGAAWKNRPAYDCDAAVAGERSDDGLWTFDLTTLASEWLEVGSTASRSVALVEEVEAPESFQVVLDGPKLEGVGVELVATDPPPADDGDGGDDGLGSDTSAGGGGGGLGSSGSGSGGSGDLGTDLGGSPAAGEVPTDTEPVAADEADASAEVAPVAGLPSWYDGIPKAGYLLLPLALGLAYLIMLALGPDARPVPTTGRHGVSRALDRLRQAGNAMRSPR